MVYDIYLPRALEYGCDFDLFWRLNPRKLKAFEKAYIEKIKGINDYLDILAWRIGYYNVQATQACWGKNRTKYPEKPDCRRETPEAEQLRRTREYFDNHTRYMRQKKKKAEDKNDGSRS